MAAGLIEMKSIRHPGGVCLIVPKPQELYPIQANCTTNSFIELYFDERMYWESKYNIELLKKKGREAKF